MLKRTFFASAVIAALVMTGCAPKDKTTDDPDNEKFKSTLDDGSLKEHKGASNTPLTQENYATFITTLEEIFSEQYSTFMEGAGSEVASRALVAQRSRTMGSESNEVHIDTTFSETFNGDISGSVVGSGELKADITNELATIDGKAKVVFDDFSVDEDIYIGGSIGASVTGRAEKVSDDVVMMEDTTTLKEVINALSGELNADANIKFNGLYSGKASLDLDVTLKDGNLAIFMDASVSSMDDKFSEGENIDTSFNLYELAQSFIEEFEITEGGETSEEGEVTKEDTLTDVDYNDGSLTYNSGAPVTSETQEEVLASINDIVTELSMGWMQESRSRTVESESVDTTFSHTIVGTHGGVATVVTHLSDESSNETYFFDLEMKITFDDYSDNGNLYLGGSVVYDVAMAGKNDGTVLSQKVDMSTTAKLKFGGEYSGSCDYNSSHITEQVINFDTNEYLIDETTLNLNTTIESYGETFKFQYSGDGSDLFDKATTVTDTALIQ